ncbi:MAG: hypothetical protein B6D61_08105 [Bacteroidetes bacterium 4484_249]|nr:MAG: hypothetical protein B6D61_08105 [Bacteroidetes bacterium 4484_249]
MKKITVIILLLLFVFVTKSQNSFEFRISNSFYETTFITFEDFDNNFITIGGRSDTIGQPLLPLLINYTKPEDTIIHLISKEDSCVVLRFIINKPNGNYLFIGSLGFDDETGGLYIWETTTDYETIWETYYQLPEPYEFLEVLDYTIDGDNNIAVSGNASYSIDKVSYYYLFMGKVDMQGQLLSFNIPEPYKRSISSSLLSKPDNSGYYLIGSSSYNLTLREWIEFDWDLNISDYGLFDWENGVGGITSAKFLQNGNLLVETNFQEGISLGLFDEDFNFLKDTLLTEGDDYVPFQNNSLDFTDPETIWIASQNDDPYWTSGTKYYHLYILDSELNLKGLKYYGGNTKYFMMDLYATNDGGCILSGMVPDTVGTLYTDIYINKVMPEDVLTNAEDTPNPFDMDVNIFPNPFSEMINIKTIRKGLQFNLYTVTGNILFSKRLNLLNGTLSINVSSTSPGFYIYHITDNSRVIQSGKLIKK